MAMATMTMEPKTVKAAMDEIELDRRLAVSLEQADRGEGISFEVFDRQMNEKFANGYFSKENAKKRIDGRMKNGRR
ncbi:MAG: hypothetical protein LBU89_07910 [Fibromonadaceae bacterium]|jgi:hypothetical protein|nr:hypothetical protein [Fibromonadaceae bacterium]